MQFVENVYKPFVPKNVSLTKGVLSDWVLCQMIMPRSDCDIRLVFLISRTKSLCPFLGTVGSSG